METKTMEIVRKVAAEHVQDLCGGWRKLAGSSNDEIFHLQIEANLKEFFVGIIAENKKTCKGIENMIAGLARFTEMISLLFEKISFRRIKQ
jgi:hypothetical protein